MSTSQLLQEASQILAMVRQRIAQRRVTLQAEDIAIIENIQSDAAQINPVTLLADTPQTHFVPGNSIRHQCKTGSRGTGHMDTSCCMFVGDDTTMFPENPRISLNQFVRNHYTVMGRNRQADAWVECEYLHGTEWMSTNGFERTGSSKLYVLC